MLSTELFIKEVKKYECLYNVRNDDYKNMPKKTAIWKAIGKKYQMTPDDCKKRWKGLRDTYQKNKRLYAQDEYSSKCGSHSKRTRWRYMNDMSFLDKFQYSQQNRLHIDYGPFASPEDTLSEKDTQTALDDIKDSQSTIENVTLVANDETYLEEDSFMNFVDSPISMKYADYKIQPSCKQKTFEEITEMFKKMTEEYINAVKQLVFTQNKPERRTTTSLVLELVQKRISEAQISKDAVTMIENKIMKLVDEEIQNLQTT